MELTRFKTSPWGAWDQVGLHTLLYRLALVDYHWHSLWL
jgi:hypothetical protein